MYGAKDLDDSIGIDKEYKTFWNAKAVELCEDTAVRHKLQDKAAIQGAINTSWTLHKSDLLQIQADEVAVYVGQAYADEIAQASTLSTVQANKAKVTEITETLRLVYSDAHEDGGGDEVKELMKELRKCQSALKKSIDRKRQEMQLQRCCLHLKRRSVLMLSEKDL